jgi:outer membrane protein assembly factor BamB
VALMSVNAACINFHPAPPPIPPAAAGAAPSEAWSQNGIRGARAPLALTRSLVLVGASNRRVVAASRDSGTIRWTARLPGDIVGGVVANETRIFAATGRPSGRIQAISLAGGTVWRTNTGRMTSSLGLVEDMVAGMTVTGDVIALNAATGHVRWRRYAGPSRTAPAAAGPGRMLVTTMDSLILLETTAGRSIARRPVSGVTLAGWQPFGALLVAGFSDSAVVAIDPATLRTAWRVATDAPVLGPVAISGDTVWAATRTGTVYQIISANQPMVRVLATLDWPVTSGVVSVGPDLVLGGADGAIRGLSRDGSERWRVRIWPAVDVPPAELPDGFVAVGGDGDLHRFTE